MGGHPGAASHRVVLDGRFKPGHDHRSESAGAAIFLEAHVFEPLAACASSARNCGDGLRRPADGFLCGSDPRFEARDCSSL